MGKIYVLACVDCDYLFESETPEKCPRCESDEYEIVDVEYED